MELDVVLRTVVPIFLLMGLGFLSRKIGILKGGDERILSAYVYYFALPALFIVDLSQIVFNEENLRFVVIGVIPILAALTVYAILYFIIGLSKDTLYLLVLSTVFGSLAFFGIPFIMFAFPSEGEYLATLSASTISIISVPVSIAVLEFYRLGKTSLAEGAKTIAKKLSANPLILSILLGILLSLTKVKIPEPILTPLNMLGETTAVVAIFMLGVFLYGRKYANLATAFKLSMLRTIFLPSIAFVVTVFFNLPTIPKATIVIMHSVPVAISMIVLSERYNFHKETIASTILVSSLGAGIYLNLWLLLLGV
ncbi:MAG: AEC family transporter [Candidatus Bathyarchaeales archaeon]